MKKKILSFLLSAAIAITGIGVGAGDPVTVYAEGEGEEGEAAGSEKFCCLIIDENGDLNPWEGVDEQGQPQSGNDNDKYFKITVNGADATYQEVSSSDEYDFHYDSENHTLTLNSMTVSVSEGSVIASQYGRNNGEKLTINLIGDNNLETTDTCDAIYLNGSTVITGSALNVTGGKKDGDWCPAAISVDSGCAIFTNGATIETNVRFEGAIGFSAGDLAFGSGSYTDDETGETHTATGKIINFGTIKGKVGLFGGECTNLVSCRTNTFPNPPSDHTYIGKAYYFMDEELYPNNIQGTLNPGDWRIVGKYDENGNPRPSKIFYQWIYKDCEGSVYTEDRVDPISYLVYPEDAPDGKIEKLLKANDVAAVNDGETHVFDTDLYAVWFTNGNVTVNGNVTLDVACSSAPQETWQSAEALSTALDKWDTLKNWERDESEDKQSSYLKSERDENGNLVPWYGHSGEGIGAVCYERDGNGNVQFHDSSQAQITINGSTGFLSLSDSYQGSVTVRDDINFCATYAEKDFLNKWIYRLQWQFDGSPYRPEETYYCAVPKAGTVVVGGQFTEKVKDLALAEGVELKGQGLFEGTYFSQTETTMHSEGVEDKVAGTSAVINDNTLLVNVSKDGFAKDTYPLVRKVSADSVTAIQEKLPATAGAVAMAMDIAMIQKTYTMNEEGEQEVTGQTEVEPDQAVNLYFDKIDLSKWKNPVLYHIKDDGTVEEITFKYDAAKKHIQCATDSFSQYVFAGEPVVQQPSGSTTTDSSGGGAPSGGASATPTTETKPDGTKVETSTETKTDGTKVDTTVETKTDGTKTETVVETKTDGAKTETVVETKTDGTKKETVVETDKDGSVKTTETVTNADGSATKTEKETETNTKGKEVAVTTTTEKDADGKVTGITQTSEIDQIAGSASATVTVEKTADGKITGAEAEVDKKGASSKQGVKATLFGSVVSQITEAAGTQSVEISMTVTAGKKEYTVKADAQDLEAGNKLKVMALDEKTGEYVLVNAKTYKVNESGNVKLTLPTGMTYQLMDSKEAAVVEKQILATVKVKKSAATISEGKKTALKLSSKLNMDNVAKITYTSAKKSVATVNKNGTITAKNSGSVVITATVTLKNGKTKTVKMKIKVK